MSYITVEANYSPSHYTSWMKPSCSVIFLKKNPALIPVRLKLIKRQIIV